MFFRLSWEGGFCVAGDRIEQHVSHAIRGVIGGLVHNRRSGARQLRFMCFGPPCTQMGARLISFVRAEFKVPSVLTN